MGVEMSGMNAQNRAQKLVLVAAGEEEEGGDGR